MAMRKRPAVLIGAAAVAVVAAGVAAAVGFGGAGASTSPASDLPPATATVVKATLTRAEKVTGTLSYGTPTGVIAAGEGTLTWLAPAGSVVKLGQPVYAVDGHPVVLVHGTVPPYRTLGPGVEGPDVKQFEQSLNALGHKGFTVDDEYDWATADAVVAWQKKLGTAQTGTVTADQIVVAKGDIRIALHGVQPGAMLTAEPNQTVLTYSGTTRVVTIALDVAKQQLVKKGIPATVLLPGGGKVDGTVQSVGAVAKVPDATTGDQPGPATIDVVVAIPDQAALGTLDAAPVSVELTSETHADVLAVPVTALVALAEGGYGVQVVDGTATHYTAVETGLFAGGKVEITGEGIAEGTTVGVPAS